MNQRTLHKLSSRRGSTLLIVIALLSLLVLLAATLAYTSKLEVMTTRNFGRAVQNQTSALTGVPFAGLVTHATLPRGAVGNLDFSFDGRAFADGEMKLDGTKGLLFTRDPNEAARQLAAAKWQIQRTTYGVKTQTSSVDVTDAASRVNLNTADTPQLARIIALASSKAGTSADSQGIAARIVAWRLGPDGKAGISGGDEDEAARNALVPDETSSAVEPNELDKSPGAELRLSNTCEGNTAGRIASANSLKKGIAESEQFISDIRYPAFGDDRRFQSVADLAQVSGVSPRLVAALAPYVTTFSVSMEERPSGDTGDNSGDRSLLDINRATVDEIYAALALEYEGTKDDILLRQFAVNIVDARDEDRRPTTFSDGADGDVIGLERTPFIAEIYPDAVTDDKQGDDGQFAEIFNPWEEPVSLAGWTLRVGTRDYPLKGTIVSNGYLIVTDDYKNDQDPAAKEDIEGQGSFYDIFHIVSNNGSKRVQEFKDFDLPHTPGTYKVELHDDTGALIDRFVYKATAGQTTLSSHQRYNPIVRESAFLRVTPFSRPPDNSAQADAATVDRLRNAPQDLPFTSPLELFDVFAGYSQADGGKGSRIAFPVVASPFSQDGQRRTEAESSSTIDARVIDLFTVESSTRMTPKQVIAEYEKRGESESLKNALDEDESESVAGSGRASGSTSDSMKNLQAKAWSRFAMPPVGLRQGLINVNTAGETVLESAGFTPSQATSVDQRRRNIERDAIAEKSSRTVLYDRLSDVLVDEELWGSGNDTCEAIRQFAPLYSRLTVNSRAFLLEGHAVEPTDTGTLQSSAIIVTALMAMDKPAPELVSWSFTP